MIAASEMGASRTRSGPEPLQQPRGDAESAAQDADVLAHDEHARVLLHQIEMRRTQCLLQGEGAHRTSEAA